MADSSSDETLMIEFQQGNYHAFETLYTRHKQPLLRFMFGLCANQAVTEELFQEVWMKIIDAKDRYQVKAKFTTYLYQIARNRIIDHFRKHSTHSEYNAEDIEHYIEQKSGQFENRPDRLLEADQALSSFTSVLNSLPSEQREVFLLKENAGMSLDEISEMLDENKETVKSRLRYAVKKLHAGLQ